MIFFILYLGFEIFCFVLVLVFWVFSYLGDRIEKKFFMDFYWLFFKRIKIVAILIEI